LAAPPDQKAPCGARPQAKKQTARARSVTDGGTGVACIFEACLNVHGAHVMAPVSAASGHGVQHLQCDFVLQRAAFAQRNRFFDHVVSHPPDLMLARRAGNVGR